MTTTIATTTPIRAYSSTEGPEDPEEDEGDEPEASVIVPTMVGKWISQRNS